jgi:hypothetical protein
MKVKGRRSVFLLPFEEPLLKDSPYALFAYIISDIAQKDLKRFAGQGLK